MPFETDVFYFSIHHENNQKCTRYILFVSLQNLPILGFTMHFPLIALHTLNRYIAIKNKIVAFNGFCITSWKSMITGKQQKRTLSGAVIFNLQDDRFRKTISCNSTLSKSPTEHRLFSTLIQYDITPKSLFACQLKAAILRPNGEASNEKYMKGSVFFFLSHIQFVFPKVCCSNCTFLSTLRIIHIVRAQITK